MLELNKIYNMDCMEGLGLLPDNCIDCCVTSPPYWSLRDYGVKGQLGLESTPEEYVTKMVEVFREVKRVLRSDGTLWLNLGDTYAGGGRNSGNSKPHPKAYKGLEYLGDTVKGKIPAGLKPKDIVGIPWMVAFALRADGWYLRSDIIWSKPNPMPESVTDRPTKSHEYIFLMSKSKKYYYDQESISEACSPNTHARLSQTVQDQIGSFRAHGGARAERPMKAVGRKFDPASRNKNNPSFDAAMAIMPEKRNKRSVWTVTTKPFKEAHFAVFPPDLIEPCILAGCPLGGVVLDPFLGSGTVAMVAKQSQRNYIGIELNKEYIEIAERRVAKGYGQQNIKGNTAIGQLSIFDLEEVEKIDSHL